MTSAMRCPASAEPMLSQHVEARAAILMTRRNDMALASHIRQHAVLHWAARGAAPPSAANTSFLVPVMISEFRSERAATRCEIRNRSTRNRTRVGRTPKQFCDLDHGSDLHVDIARDRSAACAAVTRWWLSIPAAREGQPRNLVQPHHGPSFCSAVECRQTLPTPF